MNFNQLINQVLGAAGQQGRTSGSQGDWLRKLGGGAAAAGLAGMLFKNKSSRKLVQVGSMAALGALAYHAYQNWQRQQKDSTAVPAAIPAESAFLPQGQQAEDAGRVVLRTMIAAAAADGQIDAAERSLIEAEAGDDAQLQQWLANELRQPASAAAIAADIGPHNPALAAEAYLAARMVSGELSRPEIVFLAQLSQALNLPADLVDALEKQAGF